MSNRPVAVNSYLIPFIKSLGLHVSLGVIVIMSASLTVIKRPQPKVINIEPIESVAIDQNKLQQQINQIKTEQQNKRRAEAQRVKDLEDRANRAQQRRQNEENKIKELNKKTRQSNAERRKAEAAAKQARQKQQQEKAKAERLAREAQQKQQEKLNAERQAAAAKARKLKAEEEERRAEQARIAKEKQEKERRQRKAREERERREAELELQRQMAAEQAARERAHNQQVLSEIDKFTALIQQSIKQSTIVSQSQQGKRCEFTLKLASTGFVTNFIQRKGDPIVCKAVETAVYQQGKLPMSKDPAVFEKLKTINITFIADPNQ